MHLTLTELTTGDNVINESTCRYKQVEIHLTADRYWQVNGISNLTWEQATHLVDMMEAEAILNKAIVAGTLNVRCVIRNSDRRGFIFSLEVEEVGILLNKTNNQIKALLLDRHTSIGKEKIIIC